MITVDEALSAVLASAAPIPRHSGALAAALGDGPCDATSADADLEQAVRVRGLQLGEQRFGEPLRHLGWLAARRVVALRRMIEADAAAD